MLKTIFFVLPNTKNIFHVLQAWVFEHLSTIPASENVLENDCKKPFAAKWLALRDTNKVVGTNVLMDQL